MPTQQLSITNVVNVSVATPPAGLADYKINNLALFTKELPVAVITDFAVYLDPAAVATDWGSGSETYAQAVAIFSQTPNILDGGGSLIVCPMVSNDTISTMLTKMEAKVFFGGAILGGYTPLDAEVLAGAQAFQASKKLLFISNNLLSSVQGGGIFTQIQAATLTACRCLLYTTSASSARAMAAAYAGRAMSTDFNGSATCATMHMKELVGVTPDSGVSQATLELCKTVGADVYCYFGPLPKIFSTGGNTYYDQVYGTLWLAFAMQVAGFNAIATSPTKLPQTEPGMAVLRNAYTAVCQQAVTNGFSAAGSWNSPQLFGNPDELKKNVLQRGFYVYSQPVNLQSQTSRVARQAPLVQIALKLAGAIHSTNVIVYINP